eukprot:1943434-Amphidinium_carterae.1
MVIGVERGRSKGGHARPTRPFLEFRTAGCGSGDSQEAAASGSFPSSPLSISWGPLSALKRGAAAG